MTLAQAEQMPRQARPVRQQPERKQPVGVEPELKATPQRDEKPSAGKPGRASHRLGYVMLEFMSLV
jgi:hypothetical protein